MAFEAKDQPTFYKRAVDTFELPREVADKIAGQMAALGVARDDEYMLLFLATGRIEYLVKSLPEEISKSGREIVEQIKATVADTVRAQVAAVPADLSSKLEDAITRHLGKITSSASEYYSEKAKRDRSLRLSAIVFGAAILVVVGAAAGYLVGGDKVSSDSAAWQSLVNMKDGQKWLRVAKLNQDFDKAFSQGCGIGQGSVISGAQVCQPTLWNSTPVATSKGIDYVRLSAAEYAHKIGVYGILAVGAVLGFVLGRASKRKTA
ncbi:hypothetical protein FY136_28860 (plasmid) [Agrobacterium tumefaciens]|uniref:hypothetical protein n=1 Tax=Agrobacterium tumefaciens TaxID=358 RepID=UPI0021D03BA7|nr:hypothetical protein [Agrobacterium tumefaciens]UXT53275.1 hypothetical protein FY136_28860 [Agrobacterium tumefaciens]